MRVLLLCVPWQEQTLNTNDRIRPFTLFRALTDDSCIVLGGQHIATVLLEVYRRRTATIQARAGAEVDSDLALSDEAGVGTMLKPNTALRVCRMTAGLHQLVPSTDAC